MKKILILFLLIASPVFDSFASKQKKVMVSGHGGNAPQTKRYYTTTNTETEKHFYAMNIGVYGVLCCTGILMVALGHIGKAINPHNDMSDSVIVTGAGVSFTSLAFLYRDTKHFNSIKNNNRPKK